MGALDNHGRWNRIEPMKTPAERLACIRTLVDQSIADHPDWTVAQHMRHMHLQHEGAMISLDFIDARAMFTSILGEAA